MPLDSTASTRATRLRHMVSRLPEGSAFRRHIEDRARAIEQGLPDPGPTPPATPLSDILDNITPSDEE